MWSCQHTVECAVPREFAWRFWTTVSNWPAVDPSLEQVALDGPFAAGAVGVNRFRDRPEVKWRIVEVRDGTSAVIEVEPLSGVFCRFIWKFEDVGGSRCRLGQQATIDGKDSEAFVSVAGPELERGISEGMRRLCAAMSKAHGER